MSHVAVRIGVVIASVCTASATLAETRAEEAVRLAKLTLSAMECANLAADNAGSGRLGLVALIAGRKFLDVISEMSDEERKTAGKDIAVLWRAVPGPSADFILGRVWQEVENNVSRSLGEDTSRWEREKARKYSEKNCMIIR